KTAATGVSRNHPALHRRLPRQGRPLPLFMPRPAVAIRSPDHYRADRVHQLLVAERLDQMVDCAALEGVLYLIDVRAGDDDRNRRIVQTQKLDQTNTIHVRHVNVAEHEINPLVDFELHHRFDAVRSLDDLVTLMRQQRANEITQALVILNDQNSAHQLQRLLPDPAAQYQSPFLSDKHNTAKR